MITKAGVVGFNNLGINNVLDKKITTIATNRAKIGELAACQDKRCKCNDSNLRASSLAHQRNDKTHFAQQK